MTRAGGPVSANPEELEEIHDVFLDQLLAVIPRPVIEAVRGPGSVEDDIVLAVKAMAGEITGLNQRLARIWREAGSS
jgi:hypothetical protein